MVNVEVVRQIVHDKPATSLAPEAFFLARSGVLTLAFRGFSPSLLAIKKEVANSFPRMSPEFPGSRWPKITLAALKPGLSLSLQDVLAIHKLCAKWRETLLHTNAVLPVAELSVVHYQCRSLEKRTGTHSVPLATMAADNDDPPAWHRANVDRIMRQFTIAGLDQYLPRLCHVERDIGHYRQPSEGSTLVVPVPSDYLPVLSDFARAVDERLPGYYEWIDPESRHVTVRTLAEMPAER